MSVASFMLGHAFPRSLCPLVSSVRSSTPRRLVALAGLALTFWAAVASAQSDGFAGTTLNASLWQVSSPLLGSTVSVNNNLGIASDGTIGAFPAACELFGPGAGIGTQYRFSGDFDIQVSFSAFSAPAGVATQAFFNIYQDAANQLHIKRLQAPGVNGVQSVSMVGGTQTSSAVTPHTANAGRFRIQRTGNVIRTFVDTGSGFVLHRTVSGAFTGNVHVSLMCHGAGASITYDDFTVTSGATAPETGGQCVVPPPCISAWWPAESNVNDRTAAWPPGTLRGGATYIAGRSGASFRLDGVDDWVELPNGPGDFGPGDFSLDLWVLFDNLSGEQVLAEDYVENFTPTAPGWSLSKLTDQRIVFGFDNTTLATIPAGFIQAQRWHHIALTRSGSSMKIYLDGVQRGTGSSTRDFQSTATLKLGHRGNPSDTPGSVDTRGFYLRGRIDEVAIHGCALSGAEISSIHAASCAGRCVNTAPVLASIGDKTIGEGQALSFVATATDPQAPPQTLTFSLGAGAPAGATIDASSGAFSWTPTEVQGPGSYRLTIRVRDNGAPVGEDSETITIAVSEVNAAPVLAAIGDQSVAEGSALSFTASATDADHPPNALSFSLDAGAPAGATIEASSGAFSWTPEESQGPGSYPVTVRVTDNGDPAASDFETITIAVSEVNAAPVLAAIGDQSVAEGSALSFTASATDADHPPNALTFSLDAGAPTGAAIEASSGAFSWTPDETQGPGSYPVTVRVTDNGDPAASDFETITIAVSEVNAAPVLAAIGDKSVAEGAALSFTASATDADHPPNALTFSLDSGAPAGAAIDASSGAFSWTPDEAQGPGSHPVTIRVTDNGNPAASDHETITVTVSEVNQPPVLTAPGPQTVNQGQTLTFSTSATDPDLPANTLAFSLVSPPTPAGAAIDPASGQVTWTPSTPGSYTIRVKVEDGNGGSDTKDVPVTVNTTTITVTITAPPSGALYPIGTAVTFTGAFSGDGPDRTHTAQWTFDAITQAGTVNEAGTVSTTYTFTSAGVYMVKLTVTNDLGVSGTATQVNDLDAMVVIFDPNGGHITGGGWIVSPPGSYPSAPSLSGKTNFGFVSKYHKNETVPRGETQFHFKDGDLKFQSTAYEWMVISGARAQNKGTGTINGSGSFSFLMTVIDGQRPGGGGVDRFRMKIWNTATGAIVYDNQPGAADNATPLTALGGGSLVIHSKYGGEGTDLEPFGPVAVQSFALPPNAPNPFRSGTAIRFDLPRPRSGS
jgi:PKD repeat protein